MKPPLIVALIWFASLGLLFVFTAPISQALFFLFPVILWAVLFAGCLIAIVALATVKRDHRRGGAVLVICLIGFSLYYSNVGFEWGRYVLFQIRKPMYVQQLAEAKQRGHVSEDLGRTDNGPPKLHGFFWQRGILDNWSVVVYDPTGRVAKINDANGWDEIHSHDLSSLFGGTYYRCQHVGGGWYICWFT
ncbi:MAG: hypothetical protein QF752_09100 [Planctomycetota bacterium]|jgi:hypothetical protein|nr:hypothetical protein [Planctomycetota bacterium]